ncbi:MAG: IS21 family transposase, partial [Bacteroidota bacterium]
MGINKTDISKSMGCSRNTVRTVLKHAQALGLTWPLPAQMTDEALQQKFFQTSQEQKGRRYPDVKHIHKELMRDGVNLKILWSEYCTQCRQANELPLMYSQFCELYRRYA